MTTITISDLATSPQINSRRVAHDLIEWLAHRGWVIVQGAPELPFGRDPYPPAPLPPATVEPVGEWFDPAVKMIRDHLHEIMPSPTQVEYWQRVGAGLDA